MSKAFGENYAALMEKIGEAAAATAHPVEKCPHRFGPVRPIATKDYICRDDGDRGYWHREGGDVKLSDKMEDWLKEVSREFWRICRELETESMGAGKSVRLLFENLHLSQWSEDRGIPAEHLLRAMFVYIVDNRHRLEEWKKNGRSEIPWDRDYCIGIAALWECQRIAEENGISDMTPIEINAEIAAARAERDRKKTEETEHEESD